VVIGASTGGHARGLALSEWGFIPHWAQNDASMKLVKARAETVATTQMFADSFRLSRCIVPADGFYEWKIVNKKKLPVGLLVHDILSQFGRNPDDGNPDPQAMDDEDKPPPST
jgi:putative SOS response-associated peptidase YedK